MGTRPHVDADPARRTRPWAAICTALVIVACDGHRDSYVSLDDSPGYQEILSRNIDVGEGLDMDPGRGAGVVIEAHPGGEWRVAATGDAIESGYLVRWDLVLGLEGARDLEVLDDASLDEGDHLRRIDSGAVRLALITGYGDDPPRTSSGGDAGASDGGDDLEAGATPPSVEAGAARLGDLDVVRLRAPDGAPLQVDVIIEGLHDASYVTWVGDGAVRAGAPSNPIIFVPVTP